MSTTHAGTLTSVKRGKVVTTIVCFSAVTSNMPHMFIFPNKGMNPELLDGVPVGSCGECHESGSLIYPLATFDQG